MSVRSLFLTRWLRFAGCAVLLVLLLLLGSNDSWVFSKLTQGWQHYSGSLPAALSAPTDPAITKRLVPVVVLYTLLYISLCLLLLALLLGTWQRFRFALYAYAGSFVLCLLLLVLGKLTHNTLGMYQLGRNLIDFTVSPLPVMGLAPLLYWYYPAPALSNRQQEHNSQ
ncbi:hypothetical protein HER32_08570 [Hymenobacter sp. BT18]|uniref:XrtX-associated membrane protein n=1 Tax=Hymenobacter sp. BT18 TaxID=2835648 RepID=UPI00143E84C4|nr:hypothetical protein [Hymenobacter sp. BT18]QIX61228.1 hypothetical protein HER32_08570 [Hymenobacter sp. BT18]